MEFPHPIDPLLADLLQRLLNKNPVERIDIVHIKVNASHDNDAVQQHPWINKGGSFPAQFEEFIPVQISQNDRLSAVTKLEKQK